MKVEKLLKNIGKKLTISEEMEIVHSVQLSGEPLSRPLTVSYLRGNNAEMIVQVHPYRGKKRNWDLAAVVNADFESGKLDGLKKFAEQDVDTPHPVASLRQLLIRNSECAVPKEQPAKPPAEAMVSHSQRSAN